MALVVEDGTARVDSESYASAAEATAYHTARGNAAWAAVANDTTREEYLRKATDYMQQAYRERWLGTRVTGTQALDWPRAWVPLFDVPYGYRSYPAYIQPTVVPTEVKRACMELALESIGGDLAPALDRQTLRERVDVIEVEYSASSPQYKRYRDVDMLLSPFLQGSGASSPLVRA